MTQYTTHLETPDPARRQRAIDAAFDQYQEAIVMARDVYLATCKLWAEPYEVCDVCGREVDQCPCQLEEDYE
jgi:hypothetical protein